MAAAEKHILVLRPILQLDRRFKTLRLAPFTGADGSLLVFGDLDSKKDLEDLKQIVGTSNPPIEVVYWVTYIPLQKVNQN